MPRAKSLLPAVQRQGGQVVDTLILPFAQREAKQGFVFGARGTCVEFDFPEPVRLRTDDALVLEDGTLVEIVAEAEPLLEVKVRDAAALARLAWHLGSRHVPVQILERGLRIGRDAAIGTLLEGLGLKVVAIEAPFEPEGDPGSYSHDHAHHDHGHAHHHHAGAHHEHGPHHAHDSHCGHDHHHGHHHHGHDHPKR